MAARNLLPDSNVFDREGRTKVYRSSPGVSPAPRKMCPPTPQARRNTRSCSGSSSRGSCATSWQDGDEDEPDVRPLWHTDGLLQDAFPWSSRSFTLLELTGEGDFGQVCKKARKSKNSVGVNAQCTITLLQLCMRVAGDTCACVWNHPPVCGAVLAPGLGWLWQFCVVNSRSKV